MSIDDVIDYHQRTKHDLPNRFARSLGYMDWKTQPNPFRLYEGAEQIPLDHPEPEDMPRFDSLYLAGAIDPRPMDGAGISQLLFDSMALSAWKAAGPNRWSLRCNPSSGNLHPTESYLLSGPLPGLCPDGGVFHYSPLLHALERRAVLSSEHLESLGLEGDCCLVGLTTIFWRESWKYGERAFRYCQLDVGHALAALGYAAAGLGWRVHLLGQGTDDAIAGWCGVAEQTGPDAEHPDGMVLISSTAGDPDPQLPGPGPDLGFAGEPNPLSQAHHPWPVIDDVGRASRKNARWDPVPLPTRESSLEVRPESARRILRQRRSAVAMDGSTGLSREDFFRMLERLMPAADGLPFASLGGPVCVHPLLFVHRVRDLPAGLYLLVRTDKEQASLRAAMRDDFAWRPVPECPLPLFLLEEGNLGRVAELVSCHQEIAAQGAFAVSMLARFEATLQSLGPAGYRRLFWEAGALGQVLYLEAEACGLRGTGIGCFFDDAVHELVGIDDRSYQAVYHFTVGRPVEDPRLQTLPAYHHLD